MLALSKAEARRIVLRAQGFGAASNGSVGTAKLRRLIADLGAVQIDSVNVLVRSHYLPAFSRFGEYDRALLERAAYGKPRRVFEYFGHEASFLPIETFPLFRWRMEQSRKGIGVWRLVAQVGRERKDLVRKVRAAFEERGPLSASDFEDAKSVASWWGWSDTKRAVEFLYWCGEITPAKRRTSFERVYDLTERIIPREYLHAHVDEREAHRRLIAQASQALGIATEADLRDYFRLPVAGARGAVADLVESQMLIPVTVAGWKQRAYLYRDARRPRKLEASALLSPFDSLVWNRPRTHRLFNFHYRIEIYTPAHKRLHGYYVLPYLLNEDLTARVDLKADRDASTLLVHAIHYEPDVNKRNVRAHLHDDLKKMAQWLRLERVRMPAGA
jgi:uncharacterized protein YcaQ